MNPTVNIILVNYSNSRDTLECIASIQKSTYRLKRIIVVDNSECIEDESVFLKDFLDSSSIVHIKIGRNLGFAGGNNVGIKESLKDKPDYVLLLNNDTVVGEGFLEKLICGAIEEKSDLTTGKIYYHDKPGIVWGAGGYIDWKRGMGCLYGINQKDIGQFNKIKEISFVSGCMMLIKSSIFEKIGYLDEKYFMYYEDLDFCLRAKDAGFKLAYIPDSVIWHKVGATKLDKAPFYFYYFVRNSIFIIKKFASLKQKVFYILYFSLYILYKTFCALLKDIMFIPALFWGLIDGMQDRGGVNQHGVL